MLSPGAAATAPGYLPSCFTNIVKSWAGGLGLELLVGACSGRAADFIGQRTVGQRFRQMNARHFVGAVEIRQRAGDPQHPVIAARRKLHRIGGLAQQREPAAIEPGNSSSTGPCARALVRTWGRPSAA